MMIKHFKLTLVVIDRYVLDKRKKTKKYYQKKEGISLNFFFLIIREVEQQCKTQTISQLFGADCPHCALEQTKLPKENKKTHSKCYDITYH